MAHDWRAALDDWYLTRRQLIDAATDHNDTSRRAMRAKLAHLRHTTLTTTGQLRNALLSTLDAGDTTLDELAALHDMLARGERDYIGASYRAGLAAGGQPNDWVSWYRNRITCWPNTIAAQRELAALQDPDYRAGLEALPDYWR